MFQMNHVLGSCTKFNLDKWCPSFKMKPMKPAVRRIFCCSVFVASGVVAVYVLISYTIAFAYELLWILESEVGLPPPAYLLAICYFGVMVATSVLIHGLATNNLRCILGWLIAVILLLIPECCFVFYMSIGHWGLQSIYGMTELIFYLVRLLAIVIGVVIIQSYYATKLIEAQMMMMALEGNPQIANNLQPSLTESEFNASSFVPGDTVDSPSLYAYTNYGMIREQSKFAHSMPDLREEFIQKAPADFSGKMSKYWQPPIEEVPGYHPQFIENFPPNYVFPHYTRSLDRKCKKNFQRRSGSLVELQQLSEVNNRNMYTSYGNNILPPRRSMDDLKSDPFNMYVPRDYMYGPVLYGPDNLMYRRQNIDSKYGSSKTSMGNESDDLTKYRDVAL